MPLAMVLLFVIGCAPVPPGVKATMYATESTLNATVQDAHFAVVTPWAAPASETQAQKTARLTAQVDLCIRMMEAAAKNLRAVNDYFESNRTTTMPSQ
jgi:hypothetical protein